MARMSKDERLAKVHQRALAEFDRIQSAMWSERKQCLQDRRFYSIPGAQWEGPLANQFENKPKFEVNKVHLSVMRIINEYRNNRITVDFVDKAGNPDNQLAEVCDGLYRADEQDSGAEEAYDNAFEEGVGGGFGAARVRACYEDESDPEDERQRIRIEPIYDADSCVFFDLDAKRQDKADARCCFVLSSQTPQSYKEEWGDSPSDWPKAIAQSEFDWATPDLIYVAEYYEVETRKEVVRIFQDLNGEETRYREADFENDEALEERLIATGSKEVRQKKISVKKVHKYIMSGGKVLDDCGYIAGDQIPIVPFYGKRWFVDGVERCMGHVRLVKDAQRLKNMQLSKLGEISALSTVEKPILMPEQIAGHAVMWAEDNLKNYPFLLINPITDASGQQIQGGPVAYTRAPQIPPAMAALLQITEQDMQEIMGNPQGADKMVSNISGKAVESIQTRLDLQTYIYMSNFAKFVKRCGEVWLGMAKEVYVEEGREMKTVETHGATGTIQLMRPMINKESGALETENDISQAKFDVAVEVGPTSSSRREATVRNLMSMLAITQDPETQGVLQSAVMMNMDGEGMADFRQFFRAKLVKMGVIKPTDEEAQQMAQAAANQPPDPNAVYLQAAAEEAQANAVKARVDTLETVASTELKRAQAAKTRADVIQTVQDVSLSGEKHGVDMLTKLTGAQPSIPQAERSPYGH